MGIEDVTVNVDHELSLGKIAKFMSHQLMDEDVLTFLAELDKQMSSWDFTQKAADLFVREAATLNVGQAVIARVTEFARQSEINPNVAASDFISGAWTDPKAQPTQLSLSDLKALIELATVGYVSMIEARSNPR